MSESCGHDCENCSANCSERKEGIPKEPLNAYSSVKKVIGVVSGGGRRWKVHDYVYACRHNETTRAPHGDFGCRYHRPIDPEDFWNHRKGARK